MSCLLNKISENACNQWRCKLSPGFLSALWHYNSHSCRLLLVPSGWLTGEPVWMRGCDPQASVEAAGYVQQVLVPLGGNQSPITMSQFKPRWWAHWAIRSLPLQFGGRALSGPWGWQRHPVIWAQQRNPLPSFIAHSRGASTSTASTSFSFLFLFFHSLLLFLCFILALIAQQFGASTRLRNQKLRFLS